MTAISKLRGTQLLIKVGNGASPEVFAHPCLINTKRGLKFTSSANKVITPDCDNPDDPAWTEVIKDALSASVDGAGKHDNKPATVSFYDAWFRGPDAKNVQVWLGDVGYWSGPFQLTNWEINGDRNDNCDVSISLESDGDLGAFIVAP